MRILWQLLIAEAVIILVACALRYYFSRVGATVSLHTLRGEFSPETDNVSRAVIALYAVACLIPVGLASSSLLTALVLAALAYAGLKLGQYAAKRGFKRGQLDYLQRRARSSS